MSPDWVRTRLGRGHWFGGSRCGPARLPRWSRHLCSGRMERGGVAVHGTTERTSVGGGRATVCPAWSVVGSPSFSHPGERFGAARRSGFLAPGSTASPRLPRAELQWHLRGASPVTVAGAASVLVCSSGSRVKRLTDTRPRCKDLGRLPCFAPPGGIPAGCVPSGFLRFVHVGERA